jgi:hypothetical protein
MRHPFVLIAALFTFVPSGAEAAVYDLPDQGTFTVEGPFQVLGIGQPNGPYYVPITATVSVLADIPAINPPPGGQYGFSAYVGVSSGLTTLGYAICGGNQGGGPCTAYSETNFSPANQNAPFNLSAEFQVISISNDVFGGSTFNATLPNASDLSVLIALPDGFSIVEGIAAIPEPSSWAMLLIGFAVIGVAGWRRTWSGSAAASGLHIGLSRRRLR